MKTPRTPIASFRGLNLVADPLALDPSWLVQADDVVITAAGKLQRARGHTQRVVGTAISGAYSTDDHSRLYIVDNGTMKQVHADYTTSTLATGLTSTQTRFAEVNGVVYYANGTDYGILEPSGRRPWGITPPGTPTLTAATGSLHSGTYQVCCTLVDDRGMESGNGEITTITVEDDAQIQIAAIPQVSGYTTNVYVTSQNGDTFMLLAEDAPAGVTYNHPVEQLGAELPFLFGSGPRGYYPAHFGGRMYLAEPWPELDVSVIWRSWPLHYHLFEPAREAVTVPGTVLMLAACDDALIVGTDGAIYALDQNGGLKTLAPYGVVAGDHASVLDGKLYFWSTRGLCEALPFRNLTQGTVSVAPGLMAGGRIVELDGFRRYMVALHQGGSAYNAYSSGSVVVSDVDL